MAVSLGYVLFLLMLAMVVLVFDVPMRGSFASAHGLVFFLHAGRVGLGADDFGIRQNADAGPADRLRGGHGHDHLFRLCLPGGYHAAVHASDFQYLSLEALADHLSRHSAQGCRIQDFWPNCWQSGSGCRDLYGHIFCLRRKKLE